MSCVDKVEEDDKHQSASSRGLKRNVSNTVGEAEKALRDNFKGYTREQTRMVFDADGKNVLDRIIDRKSTNNGEGVARGKHFYQELKVEFFGHSLPDQGFPIPPTDDVEDDTLEKAARKTLQHNRDFVPLLTYLQDSNAMNTINFQALMRVCLLTSPGGKDNIATDFLKDVMHWVEKEAMMCLMRRPGAAARITSTRISSKI